ncbi:MAG: hypothetical protein RR540_00195 [Oscillospiraceae bacterium]
MAGIFDEIPDFECDDCEDIDLDALFSPKNDEEYENDHEIHSSFLQED